ncbi:MAG: glucokinase [Rhodospirillaceae bacterium]|jgi:glucokinase|nr:glucokinase [Rhodospirillaceae bacterium]
MTGISLVADVGGTNVRFALVRDGEALEDAASLVCADYPDLASAIRAYLSSLSLAQRPSRAAIAVASPVLGDRVNLTNNGWTFSIADLQVELALTSLSVLNDFTALALAVPGFDESDVLKIGGGEPVQESPIAVIGPGTGLGVSGLIPSDTGWVPLETEGGHTTLAVRDAREQAVVVELAQRFDHVSVERAVSGPGLVNLHDALAAIDGAPAKQLSPDQITEAAMNQTDEICIEAVGMFCAMLGTAAGNLALTLGALGGVYIGGGIAPRLGQALAASRFRACFEDKGRFRSYMEAIPSYVISREFPTLIGLAQHLQGVG